MGVIVFFKPRERFELLKYNSKSVYVYNLTDEREELSLNATEKRSPASLVKIMTTLVAFETGPELSDVMPVNGNAYQRAINENASMAGFVSNESTTFRDLLYGTMLPSGGECADTICYTISENGTDFVELMNQRAKSMVLKHTQFKNADELDENGQYSSAKDITIMLKEALKDGDFQAIFTRRDYLSTMTLDHPQGLYMESTVFNKLNNYYQEGFEILGGKSGTTNNAGLCWAVLANKDGKEYIVVTMGASENDLENADDGQIVDALKILEEI